MVAIKIEDGTPEGTQPLCVTCRWGHIVKGFRVSQEIIRCVWLAKSHKRHPSKRDMESIAWILLTKKTGRTIGFVTAKQFHEIEGDDAEIIPAAAVDSKQSEE